MLLTQQNLENRCLLSLPGKWIICSKSQTQAPRSIAMEKRPGGKPTAPKKPAVPPDKLGETIVGTEAIVPRAGYPLEQDEPSSVVREKADAEAARLLLGDTPPTLPK